MRILSKPSLEGYRNTIELLIGNNVLRNRNAKESWALLEDHALYDNESWNNPRDFAKPVKAIALPQDVLSTSDRRLIELENQVQRLMEAYLASTQPAQVKKSLPHVRSTVVLTTLSITWKIPNKPLLNTHPRVSMKQEVSGILSSPSKTILVTPIIHHGEVTQTLGLVSNFMASQDPRLSKFEADFKQQQSEMTNKTDTMLKSIIDRIARALPSDMVKNPKLSASSVLSACSYQTIDPQCSSYPSTSINAIKAYSKEANISQASLLQTGMGIKPELRTRKNGSAFVQRELPVKMEDPRLFTLPCRLRGSKPFDTLADLESCVKIIPPYLFKKINVELLEETGHVFGLADKTKSCPVGIVKDIEVHTEKLKQLNDFYVIDIKKDPQNPSASRKRIPSYSQCSYRL
uniref:MAK10-like protein n=1 Tax=Tanacetum cinerariifolium TaxID=118510 RepID=A0A6L2J0A6_TANCI|nr:MAK10-like protein [Tanacetum cinerariifolium]